MCFNTLKILGFICLYKKTLKKNKKSLKKIKKNCTEKILTIIKQLIMKAIIFTINAEYSEKCQPKNKVAKCTRV